jgi:hypothetical protein
VGFKFLAMNLQLFLEKRDAHWQQGMASILFVRIPRSFKLGFLGDLKLE